MQIKPYSAEWFTQVGIIDYCYFALGQFVKNPRSPIAQMIDAATGYDKEQCKNVRLLIRQIISAKKKIGADCSADEAVLKKLK